MSGTVTLNVQVPAKGRCFLKISYFAKNNSEQYISLPLGALPL